MEFIPKHISDKLNRDLECSAVEMAKERKLVLKNLDSLGDKISEHIGKILIYSSINSYKETVSHWIREISESRLVKEFNQGFSIDEIASMHNRKEGGIRARLKRLGLIE